MQGLHTRQAHSAKEGQIGSIEDLVEKVTQNPSAYIHKPIQSNNLITRTMNALIEKSTKDQFQGIKDKTTEDLLEHLARNIKNIQDEKTRNRVKLAFLNVFHSDEEMQNKFEKAYHQHSSNYSYSRPNRPGTSEMFEIMDSMHHRLSALEQRL